MEDFMVVDHSERVRSLSWLLLQSSSKHSLIYKIQNQKENERHLFIRMMTIEPNNRYCYIIKFVTFYTQIKRGFYGGL